ncbi:tyrosine-type recombinase/integrase [Candidatus Poriferisodalis sp.]|uniref:tyrosine-type recombinase/integrase n=1 Tax=Candidatus Poriferisodalis sp. TaxID=3101277 RepID=UPI003B015A40
MSEELPAGRACRVSADALAAVSDDLASRTRRSYVAQLRAVEAKLNGEPLTDQSLSAMLAEMAAAERSPSTLALTVSAVRFAARRFDEPDPVGPRCDMVLRTHRRTSSPPRQVAAVDWTAADAASHAAAQRGDMIGLRGAAIIAVMSDALLRVSEAAALDCQDIDRAVDGSGCVTVRHSKTDQQGAGAALFLRRATITRVDRWLEAAAIGDGALFRRIRKGGQVTGDRLSSRSIRSIVAANAATIGIDGASGHSLRIGAAQSLVRSGAQLPEAMLAGRWATPTMLSRYASAELAAQGAVSRLRPDTLEQ